jgi:hypothetical protein
VVYCKIFGNPELYAIFARYEALFLTSLLAL